MGVLLKVYAKCIDGQDQVAKQRIEDTLLDPVPLEYSIGWANLHCCQHDGRSDGWLAGCCSRSSTC